MGRVIHTVVALFLAMCPRAASIKRSSLRLPISKETQVYPCHSCRNWRGLYPFQLHQTHQVTADPAHR